MSTNGLRQTLECTYRDAGLLDRLPGDLFYRHPAGVPPGDPPKATAEVC